MISLLVNIGHVKLEAVDQYISYKIDTRGDVNVLPKHLYYSLIPCPELKQTLIKLQAYNGSQIPVHRKCTVPILQDTCNVYCCETKNCTDDLFKFVGVIKSCSAYF